MTEISATKFSSDAADVALIRSEGEIEGWITDGTSDRHCGMSDWVVFLPSCCRAAHVSNGDPTWYDARSLADAVNQIKTGAELVN